MATEHKLGKRLKFYREDRDLSLESVAEQTGLTVEFIQSLEENNVYPSIGPLQKIACCYNVRLGTFIDDEVISDPIISRSDEAKADLDAQKNTNTNANYVYRSLGKGKNDRNMEPYLITIMPNPKDSQKLSSHQGEEFMCVIKGQLLVIYGKENHILQAGDTIYYNSIVPHLVRAYGDEPVEFLAVTYHP